MNKILHLGTAITFCSTALAAEFHVSPAGSDESAGSKSAPLKTISAVASKAQPGDTITVQEGVKTLTYKKAGDVELEIKITYSTDWKADGNKLHKIT